MGNIIDFVITLSIIRALEKKNRMKNEEIEYDITVAIAAPIAPYNGIRYIFNNTFIKAPVDCEIRESLVYPS